MRVTEIMSSPVITVSSGKSVSYAAEQMNQRGIGSLVVMEREKILGIITSRDIRSAHPNRIVADAMTTDPVCITSDCTVWDAYHLMRTNHIERLLVIEQGVVVGLVTREEVAKKVYESTDTLTGLYRAPYIQCIGEGFLKKKNRFHLLFIDVNDFGKINKKYGHPFGDDVIRRYASILTEKTDTNHDYLCRYAGDEFVMISSGEEEQIAQYIRSFQDPILINNIEISAAVGYINGFREPDFFLQSFRDLVKKASLLSSASKLNRV